MTQKTIEATDETIKDIVKQEIERLGNDADLNHIDVSGVTDIDSMFDECPILEKYKPRPPSEQGI